MILSTARDDVTISAPQVGKTTTAQAWLLGIGVAVGRTDHPWWWVGPTYAAARHGFLGMCDMAIRSGIMRPEDRTTTVPLQARTIDGVRFEARSFEKPDNLRGPTLLGAAIDEFGLLNDRSYQVLSGRRSETVTQGLGLYRWIGNVGEIGGPAEALWNSAEAGKPGFACRRWTWRDRALAHPCGCAIPEDRACHYEYADRHAEVCGRGIYLAFIRDEAGRMDARTFRQEYEAEWVDWNLLPAYTFDRAVNVNAQHAEYDPALPVELACDFNVDPMAWVLGQHRGEMAWAFDEIILEGGATSGQACGVLREKFQQHGIDPRQELHIYGDRSGKSRDTRSNLSDYEIILDAVDDLARNVVLCVPSANPAVTTRLNAVNGKLKPMLGDPTYYVHPRCVSLANDYARVSLKPGTREIDKTGQRNKKLSHSSDADGYRLASLYALEVARPVDVGTPDEGDWDVSEMSF